MGMRSKTERQIRRWQDQRWVIDNIIRLYGPDWDQGRSTRWNSYCGPRSTPDIIGLRSRIKRFNDISREFARIGWAWGGYWSSSKDYQHVAAIRRP